MIEGGRRPAPLPSPDRPSWAGEPPFVQRHLGVFRLSNHPETKSPCWHWAGDRDRLFGVGGYSCLMRKRVRAAQSEARLRAAHHGPAKSRPTAIGLAVADPQVLISWAAGANRPASPATSPFWCRQRSAAYASSPRDLAAAGAGRCRWTTRSIALRRGRRRVSCSYHHSERPSIEAMGRGHRRPGDSWRIRELSARRGELARPETNIAAQDSGRGDRYAPGHRRAPPATLDRSGPEAPKGDPEICQCAYAQATRPLSVTEGSRPQSRCSTARTARYGAQLKTASRALQKRGCR